MADAQPAIASPYVGGEECAKSGGPKPHFPKPGSSWAERLYARGWSDAMDQIIKDGRDAG